MSFLSMKHVDCIKSLLAGGQTASQPVRYIMPFGRIYRQFAAVITRAREFRIGTQNSLMTLIFAHYLRESVPISENLCCVDRIWNFHLRRGLLAANLPSGKTSIQPDCELYARLGVLLDSCVRRNDSRGLVS
jgi:hypothetical protein